MKLFLSISEEFTSVATTTLTSMSMFYGVVIKKGSMSKRDKCNHIVNVNVSIYKFSFFSLKTESSKKKLTTFFLSGIGLS